MIKTINLEKGGTVFWAQTHVFGLKKDHIVKKLLKADFA